MSNFEQNMKLKYAVVVYVQGVAVGRPILKASREDVEKAVEVFPPQAEIKILTRLGVTAGIRAEGQTEIDWSEA